MSQQFPATTCPDCGGARVVTSLAGGYGPHVCALCKGKGVVSHFVAAAWYAEHPEAARADTEREMPAVRLDDDPGKSPTGENKGERGP